jgi:hypothetical protein
VVMYTLWVFFFFFKKKKDIRLEISLLFSL